MTVLRKNSIGVLAASLIGAVLVQPATAEPLPELDCLVEPHVIVDVGSPEHGIVQAIEVDRSDTVSANDVLARLESGEQAAAVRKARARAAMEAEIKARQAALEFAQRKQERMRDLYASEAISSHQRDEVETELTMARMQLRQAREARALANIELERAQGDLERRTIRSPISGVIVERFVAPGEYVNEKPLLRLAQMDPLRIEAIAPSSAFGQVKTGMQAEIVAESRPGQPYIAEVTIVDKLIDPASGTFGIRLSLPNPDYAIPSGLNCRLRMLPEKQTAHTEPKPAARTTAPAASASGKPAPAAIRTAAKPPAPKPAATDVKTAILPPPPTQSLLCRSFGPLNSTAEVDALEKTLTGQTQGVSRREELAEVTRGYFVLTPPQTSVAAARDFGETLKKRGVGDLAVLTRKPNRGRVSLGLFSKRVRAEQHRRKMAELDIETEVAPRKAEVTRYWLDVEMTAATAEQAPWQKAAPGVDPMPCAKTDYVADATTEFAKKP